MSQGQKLPPMSLQAMIETQLRNKVFSALCIISETVGLLGGDPPVDQEAKIRNKFIVEQLQLAQGPLREIAELLEPWRKRYVKKPEKVVENKEQSNVG